MLRLMLFSLLPLFDDKQVFELCLVCFINDRQNKDSYFITGLTTIMYIQYICLVSAPMISAGRSEQHQNYLRQPFYSVGYSSIWGPQVLPDI